MKNQLARAPVRISLRGEFDISNKDRLTALLLPGERAEMVLIDMSETTYIDTTALGCLIRLKKTMIVNGGLIYLIGVTPNIRRILAITKLERLFEISNGRLTG